MTDPKRRTITTSDPPPVSGLRARESQNEASADATVAELARLLADEEERGGASPLLLRALREAIRVGELESGAEEPEPVSAPASKVAPGCVWKAEAYVEAHAGQPITLAELVAVTGVSGRTLQVAFQAHHGCSPMQFVKARRLEIARRNLLAPEPGTTVAMVAASLCATALGRFSLEYRERFGESPSETLRRARDGMEPRRHGDTENE